MFFNGFFWYWQGVWTISSFLFITQCFSVIVWVTNDSCWDYKMLLYTIPASTRKHKSILWLLLFWISIFYLTKTTHLLDGCIEAINILKTDWYLSNVLMILSIKSLISNLTFDFFFNNKWKFQNISNIKIIHSEF